MKLERPLWRQLSAALLFVGLLGGRNLGQPATESSKSTARDMRYPAKWWEPAPNKGAPSWEILPQEAKPGEVILSKRNELGLLSNFAATPFEFHGKRYASLEGFWQT